jgi:xylulose-5-phosphate/fructose-6-phosphate phosphoketolase
MYLASAQIFLKSNSQVSEPLSKDDIKPRFSPIPCPFRPPDEADEPRNSLLGHYGTSGGLSLAYVHAQALIRRKGEEEGQEPKMLFVTGPGHGGASHEPLPRC